MPFTCPVRLDETGVGSPAPATARLVRWLAAKGELLAPGAALATLEVAGERVQLCPTFPCMVAEQTVADGAVLRAGALMAQLYGEGEDLPYGGSYCRLHYSASPAV